MAVAHILVSRRPCFCEAAKRLRAPFADAHDHCTERRSRDRSARQLIAGLAGRRCYLTVMVIFFETTGGLNG
jgi:hypothetical protein